MNFLHDNNFLMGIMLSLRINVCVYNFLSIILLCEATNIGKPKKKKKLFYWFNFLSLRKKFTQEFSKCASPMSSSSSITGKFRNANFQAPHQTYVLETGYRA